MNRKSIVLLVLAVFTILLGTFLLIDKILQSRNLSEESVRKINWSIERADLSIEDDNDFRKFEQAISIDVTFNDDSVKRYDLGTALGCAEKKNATSTEDKKVLGRVDCYFALTGVEFTAFLQNGKFMIERHDDDASGLTDGKTEILLEI